MTEARANEQYWKGRPGGDYRSQQAVRISQGDAVYAIQERIVKEWCEQLAARLGRAPRILDFGCGFCRMLPIVLSAGAEYFGFDFSERMVEGIDGGVVNSPVVRLGNVRVGDDVARTFKGESFDGVFSVSVFIHNETSVARALIARLWADLLSPAGEILLIENLPVEGSRYISDWHAGCWVHDYRELAPPGSSLSVDPDVLGKHGLYRIERTPKGESSRLARLEWRGGAANSLTPCEWSSLVRLHISEVPHGSTHESAEVLAARLLDAQERLTHAERELLEAKAAQARLSEEGGQLRSALSLAEGRASGAQSRLEHFERERHLLAERVEFLGLLRNVAERSLARAQVEPVEREQGRLPVASGRARVAPDAGSWYVLDAARDIALAHPAPEFARVLHVFHQEWFGIRAACGALPGRKLAISADRIPTAHDMAKAVECVVAGDSERVVMHGMSAAGEAFLRAVKSARPELRVFCVWHGSLGQIWADDERRILAATLGLLKDGVFDRATMMRSGCASVFGEVGEVRPMLLNAPPRISAEPSRAHLPFAVRGAGVAVVPGWPNAYKNVAANILAGEYAPALGRVYGYAPFPSDLGSLLKLRKFSRIDYRGSDSHLDLLRMSDICLAATFIDCHPMSQLEALACGTPALMGPLFLDGIDMHPLTRVLTVENPLSVDAMSRKIGEIASVPAPELASMIRDYCAELARLSMERYADFLEI